MNRARGRVRTILAWLAGGVAYMCAALSLQVPSWANTQDAGDTPQQRNPGINKGRCDPGWGCGQEDLIAPGRSRGIQRLHR